jgi:exosortase A-associated hydrolase 1
MSGSERAIVFDCAGDPLVGILHPAQGAPRRVGVVIIVGGGPQYRGGGHRQLVLWSRRMAAEGFAVLRFDYRGMGDSHGTFRGFEDIDADIRAAVDRLMEEVPGLDGVVLWGECDASAAILFYGYQDARVKGGVLLNPWARSEAGQAKTVLRHYYWDRLRQPSFWRKVFSFKFNPLASLGSAVDLVRKSAAGRASAGPAVAAEHAPLPRDMPLPDKLFAGMRRFPGPILLFMSGRDIIAREFDELVRDSAPWKEAMAAKPTTRHDIAEGDHTFSSAEQRDRVIGFGLEWLERIAPRRGEA